MRKKSHELQWLEVISQRGGLHENEIKMYQRLKRGFQGEVSFDKMCQLFLEEGVEFLDDVTLRYQFDTVQIDKLLMAGNTVYVVDVKYYRGAYTYENNEWRVGSTMLSNNIYEQLRRAKRVVQNIFQEADVKVNVQGVLVFINPESSIKVVDAVQEATLSFGEIPGWLMGLPGENIKIRQWKNLLRAFEIQSYRTTRVCGVEKLASLEKGIRCIQCGDFNVEESRYKVSCPCGSAEVKETAYVRTICEYGLIMHDRDLTNQDLKAFFGGGNYRYLKNIVAKHFRLKEASGNSSSYVNKGELFEYWFQEEKDYFDSIMNRLGWKRLE